MRFWIALMALIFLAACEPTAEDTLLPTVMVLPSATPTDIAPTALPSPTAVMNLPYYEAVSGHLAEGQIGLWQLEAKQGDLLVIRALSDTFIVYMMLIDTAGATIGEGQSISASIAADGVYVLRISAENDGEGDYQLGLSYADTPAPAQATFTPLPQVVGIPTPTPVYSGLGTFISELPDDEIVTGVFQPAAGPQVFTFMAAADQHANILLDPVSGDGDLLMTLYNPQAVALAADSESANGAGILRDIPLADDGLYTVRVESNGAPATYTLRLNLRAEAVSITPTYNITPTLISATPVMTPEYESAQAGERLSPEQPVRAEISAQSFVNTHSFAVNVGDIFSVAVRPAPNSPLIPHVEMIDPDGVPVATLIGNRSPIDRDVVFASVTATIEGPYTLFVTGQGGTQGEYTIAYGPSSITENISKGEVKPDQPHISALERRGAADIWHIMLGQGDLISLSVSPLDALVVPILELYTGDGRLIGIDGAGNGPRSPLISGVRVPQTGLYLIKIRPAEAESIGAYQLFWRYLDIGPTPTPAAGTLPLLTVSGTLNIEEYLFYPFYGYAGQRLIISVDAAEGEALDPVAAIIGIDGEIIAEGDDSPDSLNAYFAAELPESGTYQLRLNGYLSGGAFTAEIIAVYQ